MVYMLLFIVCCYIEITVNMKHNGGAALGYLVGGGADVLAVVCPSNRHHSQLAAV